MKHEVRETLLCRGLFKGVSLENATYKWVVSVSLDVVPEP